MFIKKKFKNRHLILKTLQEFFERYDTPDLNNYQEIELSYDELIKLSTLTQKEVYEQIDFLEKQEEININRQDDNTYYLILRNGTIAYYDKKYINIGKKELLDKIYDTIKILSTIILLMIAVITFILNVVETKKNTREIESLKTEINKNK